MLFFLIINLLWVILKLPFHNRILLYVDLSMIYFAAYFLASVFSAKKYYRLVAISLLCLAAIFGLKYNFELDPLISVGQIKEIREFTGQLDYGFVLAVDSNDAPWLLGFSQNVRLGAPGLFENFHSYEEWQKFWDGSGQQEFLSVYPRPLYVYERSDSVEGDGKICLSQVSQNFYQYICP